MIDDAVGLHRGGTTPIAVRVREACRLSGIGRSKLYGLIAAGEIEIIKIGRITLIPVASLASFLQRRVGESASRRPSAFDKNSVKTDF
jgi:excisionase family DNA binding protein